MRSLNRPITIAMCVPRYNDGTSQYRGYGPWAPIVRADPSLRLHRGTPNGNGHASVWTWADLALCDVAFVQRPASPPGVQVAQMAKRAGIPVWVDWDDDVSCVPCYNKYIGAFPQPQTDQCLAQLVELADVITVTSEALRAKAGPKARVVPNAWDDYTLGWSSKPRQRIVTWRGSDTHAGDLATVLGALGELHTDTAWCWWFLGDPGWQASQAMTGDRVRVGPPWTDWTTMMGNLGGCGSYLHIVPLAPNDFNRSKSNCSWIEATAAGAVVVAPDMPEWRRPGIVNYRDERDFLRQVKRLMGEFDGGKRHPNVALSRAYIEEHLLLSKENERRLAILEELAAKNPLRSKVLSAYELAAVPLALPPLEEVNPQDADLLPSMHNEAVALQEAVA